MVTKDVYNRLQLAFNSANGVLFYNRLPQCLIILQRERVAEGYFCDEVFEHRNNGDLIHEIALNPLIFHRSDKNILSILVHEMCHLEQYQYGNPSPHGYHNKEWAGMMKGVGLQPSTTGEEGGKETGQGLSHYIIKGDVFDRWSDRWLADNGYLVVWRAIDERGGRNKTQYTCSCGCSVWGKEKGLLLTCGHCNEPFVKILKYK